MPYPFAPLFDPRFRVIDSSNDAVLRVRVGDVKPGPPPVAGGRPRGSKRPHTNAKVAEVRRLMEETTLTFREIAARSGIGVGTVLRWKRDGEWQRHAFAARATDTVPTARAGRKLRLRMLSEKLYALAERCVAELWNSPSVDLGRLIEAMQVVKMARLEAMGRHRPRRHIDAPPRTGQDWLDRDAAIRAALRLIVFRMRRWRCWKMQIRRRRRIIRRCGREGRDGGCSHVRAVTPKRIRTASGAPRKIRRQ